jgi:hypothetical protein
MVQLTLFVALDAGVSTRGLDARTREEVVERMADAILAVTKGGLGLSAVTSRDKKEDGNE